MAEVGISFFILFRRGEISFTRGYRRLIKFGLRFGGKVFFFDERANHLAYIPVIEFAKAFKHFKRVGVKLNRTHELVCGAVSFFSFHESPFTPTVE